MQKEVFESDIGESYVKAVHPSGLKIYILEKPQYNSSYAIFGTKYGSIDTCFAVNGEKVSVPEGIAHFLEHKLLKARTATPLQNTPKRALRQTPLPRLTAPAIFSPARIDFTIISRFCLILFSRRISRRRP